MATTLRCSHNTPFGLPVEPDVYRTKSGQELTARTHHTGVIRKRILPLQFSSEIDEEEDIDIRNEKRKSVGKVKTVNGKVSLGLMRLKETFLAEKLFVNDSDLEVSVRKPVWWPTDQK